MSVTFGPEIISEIDLSGYEVLCFANGERVIATVSALDVARAIGDEHTEKCEECTYYGYMAEAKYAVPHGVNMANRNAGYVMSLLGIPFMDGSGVMDAAEFLERLSFASVLGRGDRGSETIAYGGGDSATVIDCGRSPGYADHRIDQLIEVAEWAVSHNRRIVWS